VGATTDNDVVASFSNSADFLKLLAPGVSITSVKAGTTTFQTYQGTSMATPHVAAAWAVIRQADPDLSVTEVLNLLSSTGVPVTDSRSGAGNRVKPRIQLDAALDEILPEAPPAPTNLVAAPNGPSQIDLTWDDVTGETGYELEWSVDEAIWNALGSTLADVTTFSDTGMNCDTTFYYRVFAVNGAATSPASNTASATSEPCPTETELLVNGNFEDNDNANLKLPDGWIGAGALLGDKVVTDGAVIRSYSPPNAFRFKGNLNETTSTIRRKVKLANFTFNAGDLLNFSAYIDQRTGKPNAVVGRVVIDYNGDAPNSVIRLRLPATATPGYVLVSAPEFTLTNTDIASITVYLQYKPSTGTSFFDDVSLKLIPGGVALGARGALPLPAAPSELRGG
jgi:subtilisin family serine protease